MDEIIIESVTNEIVVESPTIEISIDAPVGLPGPQGEPGPEGPQGPAGEPGSGGAPLVALTFTEVIDGTHRNYTITPAVVEPIFIFRNGTKIANGKRYTQSGSTITLDVAFDAGNETLEGYGVAA